MTDAKNTTRIQLSARELEERRAALLKKWEGKLNVYSEPLESAGFAFCFGYGWDELVDQLMENLFALGWNGGIAQTKEKYGGLRFYICGGSEPIWDAIEEAEDRSYEICEECGSEDDVETSGVGWLKTLCAAHREGTNDECREQNEVLLRSAPE